MIIVAKIIHNNNIIVISTEIRNNCISHVYFVVCLVLAYGHSRYGSGVRNHSCTKVHKNNELLINCSLFLENPDTPILVS